MQLLDLFSIVFNKNILIILFLFSDFLFVIFLLVSSLRNKQTHQKTKNQLANPGKNWSKVKVEPSKIVTQVVKCFSHNVQSYFMFELSTWLKKTSAHRLTFKKLNELLFAYID